MPDKVHPEVSENGETGGDDGLSKKIDITTAAVVLEPVVALVFLPISGVLTINYGWPWALVTSVVGVGFVLWSVLLRKRAVRTIERHG